MEHHSFFFNCLCAFLNTEFTFFKTLHTVSTTEVSVDYSVDHFSLLWHKKHSMTTSFKIHELFCHSTSTTTKTLYLHSSYFQYILHSKHNTTLDSNLLRSPSISKKTQHSLKVWRWWKLAQAVQYKYVVNIIVLYIIYIIYLYLNYSIQKEKNTAAFLIHFRDIYCKIAQPMKCPSFCCNGILVRAE